MKTGLALIIAIGAATAVLAQTAATPKNDPGDEAAITKLEEEYRVAKLKSYLNGRSSAVLARR